MLSKFSLLPPGPRSSAESYKPGFPRQPRRLLFLGSLIGPGASITRDVLGASLLLIAQVPKICPRPPSVSETPRPLSSRFSLPPSAVRESFDAPENLPEEAPGQVTFGQLKDEVPRMPDQPPAGLEEPLLQARQPPALDGEGQDKATHEMPTL